jgi:hypothetical protein
MNVLYECTPNLKKILTDALNIENTNLENNCFIRGKVFIENKFLGKAS